MTTIVARDSPGGRRDAWPRSRASVPTAAAGPQTAPTAKEIVARSVAAHGGDRLTSWKTLTIKGTVAMQDGITYNGAYTLLAKAPDRVRVEHDATADRGPRLLRVLPERRRGLDPAQSHSGRVRRRAHPALARPVLRHRVLREARRDAGVEGRGRDGVAAGDRPCRCNPGWRAGAGGLGRGAPGTAARLDRRRHRRHRDARTGHRPGDVAVPAGGRGRHDARLLGLRVIRRGADADAHPRDREDASGRIAHAVHLEDPSCTTRRSKTGASPRTCRRSRSGDGLGYSRIRPASASAVVSGHLADHGVRRSPARPHGIHDGRTHHEQQRALVVAAPVDRAPAPILRPTARTARPRRRRSRRRSSAAGPSASSPRARGPRAGTRIGSSARAGPLHRRAPGPARSTRRSPDRRSSKPVRRPCSKRPGARMPATRTPRARRRVHRLPHQRGLARPGFAGDDDGPARARVRRWPSAAIALASARSSVARRPGCRQPARLFAMASMNAGQRAERDAQRIRQAAQTPPLDPRQDDRVAQLDRDRREADERRAWRAAPWPRRPPGRSACRRCRRARRRAGVRPAA